MNSKLNFIIPMAGLGRRFTDAGCLKPKFMIKPAERTLFEYSLLSLPLEIAGKVIFIVLKEHQEKFEISSFIEEKFKIVADKTRCEAKIEIILIDGPTGGQAQTALLARDIIRADQELAVYNIDTFFKSETLKFSLMNPQKKLDGIIGAFPLKGSDSKWSFAEINKNGTVARTAEKERISNNALTGFYHFTRAADFFEAAALAVKGNDTCRGEFYIAPLYNELIAKGKKFVLDTVNILVPMGTPEEVGDINTGTIDSHI